MPEFVTDDGCRLHYRLDGAAGQPLLIFSNSLGVTHEMWDVQIAPLTPRFRVLRYDTRGHGASAKPPAPYLVERLGRDVLALLDHLKEEKAHFCGLSMGGLTGMWLGRHAAHRFERLVLCNTAALIGTPELWNDRIKSVTAVGTAGLAEAVVQRWFTDGYRAANPAEIARITSLLCTTSSEGYAGACAAIRDADLRADLARIALETLVVTGRFDLSTPPEQGRTIAAAIPGARLVELEAAHLSNIEAAEAFTGALGGFLA